LLITFLRLDRVARVLSPEERTTRFIFTESHFDAASGVVKYAAFMPSAKTRNISVYRTSGCPEWRVWALGGLFVARRRLGKPTLLARGDLAAHFILQEGLRVDPDPSPHPRHAVVTNWPDDKPQQRVKAMVLAQHATLFLRPSASEREKA
jgi:hypothetical protein